MNLLGAPEAVWRLGAFVAALTIMVLAETLWPRRQRRFARPQRWTTNLSIVVLGAAALRVLALLPVPLLAVTAALWAERTQTGLFYWLAWPSWIEFALSLIVLDLLIWAQHLAFHRVPWAWRMHRVHHADREIDASTALRFHPAEIGLSMLIKSVAVVSLGLPALAVMIFEIGLNALALFNHANVRIPERVDRMLRRVLVTPDMHRIHHSIDTREHNRNFGFNLSIWDRCFATYEAAPRHGQLGMTIGLSEYQSDDPSRLGWSLYLPFARDGKREPPAATGDHNGELGGR